MNYPVLFEIFLTVIISLVGIMITIYIFIKTGVKLASSWVEKEFSLLEEFDIDKCQNTNSKNSNAIDVNSRIRRQYFHVKEKAIQHFKIMKYLQVRYYTVINMTAICGILTAILAFIIMNSGWNNSSDIIKTLFFVFSATTTYLAAFPRFFAYKLNISKNKTKSVHYRELMNRIETFLCTGFDSSIKKCKLEIFVVNIDREIDKLMDYAINLEIDTNFKPENVLNKLK